MHSLWYQPLEPSHTSTSIYTIQSTVQRANKHLFCSPFEKKEVKENNSFALFNTISIIASLFIIEWNISYIHAPNCVYKLKWTKPNQTKLNDMIHWMVRKRFPFANFRLRSWFLVRTNMLVVLVWNSIDCTSMIYSYTYHTRYIVPGTQCTIQHTTYNSNLRTWCF